MKKVEVLAFEGCPNVEATLAHVRAAIADMNEPPDIRVVLVHGEEEATHLRFLGSPSVHIDGIDIDVSARTREDYGIRCRVYLSEKGLVGAPPVEWIVRALHEWRAHGTVQSVRETRSPLRR